MTPWQLRRRLRAWLFDKLLGDFLSEPVEPEPEPAPRGESVIEVADGTPLLDAEALAMLAPRVTQPRQEEPSEPPLVGSVEERLARYRLR